MSEPRKAILLRISPDLARELHLWARDEMRSVNAQIEYLLRLAVARRRGERPPPPPPPLPDQPSDTEGAAPAAGDGGPAP